MLLTRRRFLGLAAGAATAAGVARGAGARHSTGRDLRRCIVLGFDGMDPTLTRRYMEAGRMPNLARLASLGRFTPLRTSDPPQSPVAWSNFISGANPGTHGIFDFIARDPATMTPSFSTSRITPGGHALRVGHWRLPLTAGGADNLRRGPTLWQQLERRGVPATVIRMPANFPPTHSRARALSGLGTPDIHGAYGIFTFYTDRHDELTRDVAGGHIERVDVRDGVVNAVLPGPDNTFDARGSTSDIPFQILIDPGTPAVRIRIQQADFLLREGEWSEWVPLRFPLLPHLAEAAGICRFHLLRARDDFALYVSPVNIDPADPALPIAEPAGYAADLARRAGRFYTQGMAEDTRALSAGVFDDARYREQALFVHRESVRLFEAEFPRFRDGLFFFYFSSLDLNSHALWRLLDTGHPLYDPAAAARHGDFLPWLYSDLDRVAGQALAAADDRTLLLVISDHGFGSFRRQFNLNSWLLANGYAVAAPGGSRDAEYFGGAQWEATRAYGLGINSLYLNMAEREKDGCVPPREHERLRNELIERLEAAVDPATGMHPVRKAYRPEDIYSGPEVSRAPDLIIGYSPNYRASWDTILGKYPKDVFLDNRDPWSGDHCLDSSFMQGVCFCNRSRFGGEAPGLDTLGPDIVRAFDG